MFRSIFSILLVAPFVCSPLPAQSSGQAEPSLRTDLMPVSLNGNFVAYYAVGGSVKKLEAFETGMGTPVFYKGPRTLNLYANEEDAKPREQGQPRPIPLASVTLPSGVRRVLLLPVPKGDKKIDVRALGVDDKSLAAGDYRFYNLSQLSLVGLLDKKAIRLKPGQSMDISDSSLRGKDEDIGMQIACEQDNKRKLVYSTMWGHSPQARTFVFMIGTGRTGSPVSVRKFQDIPAIQSIGYEPEKK